MPLCKNLSIHFKEGRWFGLDVSILMPPQALPAYVVTLLFFAGFLLRYPNIPNYWSRSPLALCALLQDLCHPQLMRPRGLSAHTSLLKKLSSKCISVPSLRS